MMGFFNFFKKRNKREKDEVDYEKDTDLEVNFDDVNEIINEEQELNKTDEQNEQFKEMVYDDVKIKNIDSIIQQEIIRVVENYYDTEKIDDITKEAVKNIGINNVEKVKSYLLKKVEQPKHIKKKYRDSNELKIVTENSILMIIYNFNEYGIDELLKIAANDAEHKLKAINLLCKLASKGINTEKIVDSIIFIMKELDESEVQKILVFLSQVKNDSKIARLLELYYKKYILDNNFELAYDTVINIINLKGRCSKEQLIFLKALALHEGLLKKNLILNGQDGEVSFKTVKEDLRIKSAVSFYALNKNDDEINYRLIYLKENSLQEEIREFLSDIIVQ